MNLPSLPSLRLSFVVAALASGLFWLPVFLPAQSPLAPGAPLTAASPALGEASTGPTPDEPATEEEEADSLRNVSLGLRAAYYHSAGLQAGPGTDADSEIFEFSTPLRAHINRHWRIFYTPTWRRYSNDLFKNTVNHSASLLGRATYESWTFGLGQTYARSTYPLAETARQTEFDTHKTQLRADYIINRQLFWRTETGLRSRYARDFTNYRDYRIEQTLFWSSALPVVAGFGITVGYIDINPGINQTYQRPELHLAWTVSPAVELVARAGIDSRQYRSGDVEDFVNPLFGLDLIYTPFEYTRLELGVTRDVGVSFFSNQLVEHVAWRASLEQRLLGRLNLGLRVTEHFADYILAGPSSTPVRDDRRRSFTARLDYPWRERLGLALLYRRYLQSSSAAGFNSSSTWYGVELAYRF